jgi:hypothetical protein
MDTMNNTIFSLGLGVGSKNAKGESGQASVRAFNKLSTYEQRRRGFKTVREFNYLYRQVLERQTLDVRDAKSCADLFGF